MGRLLERADKTSRILDVKYFVLLPSVVDVGTPLDTIQWAALLESASALEMYRKRHGRITPTQVAEFLMLDREFPRAMHFCLLKAEESLLAITGSQPAPFARRPSSDWAGCAPNSITPTSTRSSRRTARIHRSLSDQAESGRRGDFGDILRRASGPRRARGSRAIEAASRTDTKLTVVGNALRGVPAQRRTKPTVTPGTPQRAFPAR